MLGEALFKRAGSRYILLMMLLTRVFCFVGGALVIYYVNLALRMPPRVKAYFDSAAAVLICLSVAATVVLACWETRTLRRVLRRLLAGQPVDPGDARRASCEAVRFSTRHHAREAILVPATTVVPLCLFLFVTVDASLNLLLQIVMTGFIGISTVLLMTFFSAERWMAPVTRFLLESGVDIPFDKLPVNRLRLRMNLSFGLTIAVTAIMIGSLANQRASDIIRNPQKQEQAVISLRKHSVAITVVAVTVGLGLSHLLSNSVGSRIDHLVEVMKRVQRGSLSERVVPTGTDEIDMLARRFNAMVEQLDCNDQVIRDLNVNLEQKVRLRTRQLARSKQSLQRSLRKLQEHDQLKTQFFSNVSHEIRTPLTMILSPVEWILRRDAERLPPEVVSRLETTRINGHRLLTLINQLLDFSKLEAGRARLHVGRLDLNALVQELADAARPLAEERGLQLQLDLDDQIPIFGADREKTDAVISNLLSNALKFTPRGGEVRIETRLLGLESRTRHASRGGEPTGTNPEADAPGSPREADASGSPMVQLAVIDTGIGIAEEDQPDVFERFVQIDGSPSREQSGTGLGMALSKQFVELQGGVIDLKSRPGEGSRFQFTLPLAPPPEGDSGELTKSDSQLRKKGVSDVESHRSQQQRPEVGAAEETASGDSTSTAPAADARITETPASVPERSTGRYRFSDLVSCPVDELSRNEIPGRLPKPGLGKDAPTVLVVDDTPEVRGMLGDMLADDYRVVFAADGEQGTEVARRERPDLIISDVMMPRVDGYEFCRRMKSDPEMVQIPFVMLTAKAELSMKIAGLKCGADDYLVKPFDAEELEARMRSLLKLSRLHRDLDDRNRELQAALEELKDAQAQLVQSEKMNSLGQLVAGIAHEINNAINAVYNGIQPLQRKSRRLESLVSEMLDELDGTAGQEQHEIGVVPAPPDPAQAPTGGLRHAERRPPVAPVAWSGDHATTPTASSCKDKQREIRESFRRVAQLAEIVENGASRTARIVSDLKTFSHPGSESFEPFDLHEALEICLNLLSSQLKHRVRVHRRYEFDGSVRGPSGQLNQVFMNLLSNAEQAIDGAGEITVWTRRDQDRVVIGIRDSGSGIPDEVKSRIFDPFYTTKPPGVGTGLGLAISYGIIHKLGGTISCDSQVGTGTEFVISLPTRLNNEKRETRSDETSARRASHIADYQEVAT